MTPQATGICAACQQFLPLERHHWFEPPNLEEHAIMICHDCNMMLTTENVWDLTPSSYAAKTWNHVLPRWELQKQLAISRNIADSKLARDIIKEEYRHFSIQKVI